MKSSRREHVSVRRLNSIIGKDPSRLTQRHLAKIPRCGVPCRRNRISGGTVSSTSSPRTFSKLFDSTAANPSRAFQLLPARALYVIVRGCYLKKACTRIICDDVCTGQTRGRRPAAGGQGVYQFVATMLKSPAELERNSSEWEPVALSICAATPKLSSA